ncbi:MAG: NADH-quinone oxidoreductase subunit NuoN [Corynebacterium glucuronolyticum]|nr:NADH-quinone oxidoreductase subunit NuoN [Mycobacteriaceae bacterium]MDY5833714.1 NADH-quinone oxidoreductase subunit NuoN [Corynebacterium glucuronolyticum]
MTALTAHVSTLAQLGNRHSTADVMQAPDLNYQLLVPMLVLFGGACVAILFEAMVKGVQRSVVQVFTVGITLLATLGILIYNFAQGRFGSYGAGLLMADKPAYIMQMSLIVFTLGAMFLFVTHTSKAAREATGSNRQLESEIHALALFSLFGMVLFVASTNLLMLFIALEVLSLPLYILCSMDRYRPDRSQEASLKYFLLGVVAAALMLYGIVLTFGATGSFDYQSIATAAEGGVEANFFLGFLFIIVGLMFKIGAVPFHSWVPDVYQGAPTPVTAFMAIATKLAAFGALGRLLTLVVPMNDVDTWKLVIAIVAAVSMAYGAVVAIAQRDVKRLIAYSSIGHAGFILAAFVGATDDVFTVAGLEITAMSAAIVYLLAYGLATIGAFAVVTLVRDEDGKEATDFDSWAGVGRKHPVIGAAFVIYFLSFAGIPLTAGFIGKLSAFAVPWLAGHAWLVVVALLLSAVAAFAYFRFLTIMFFDAPSKSTRVVAPQGAVAVIIALTAILTVLMGVLPTWVISLVSEAGSFLIS